MKHVFELFFTAKEVESGKPVMKNNIYGHPISCWSLKKPIL